MNSFELSFNWGSCYLDLKVSTRGPPDPNRHFVSEVSLDARFCEWKRKRPQDWTIKQGRVTGIFPETLAACGCLREAFSPSPNRKVSRERQRIAVRQPDARRARQVSSPQACLKALERMLFHHVAANNETSLCDVPNFTGPPMCSLKPFRGWTQIFTGKPLPMTFLLPEDRQNYFWIFLNWGSVPWWARHKVTRSGGLLSAVRHRRYMPGCSRHRKLQLLFDLFDFIVFLLQDRHQFMRQLIHL